LIFLVYTHIKHIIFIFLKGKNVIYIRVKYHSNWITRYGNINAQSQKLKKNVFNAFTQQPVIQFM